jgi:hypothetical protein
MRPNSIIVEGTGTVSDTVGNGGGTSNRFTYAGGGFHTQEGKLTPEEHFRRTVIGGKSLNNQKLVETMSRDAKSRLMELREFGVKLEVPPRYRVSVGLKERISNMHPRASVKNPNHPKKEPPHGRTHPAITGCQGDRDPVMEPAPESFAVCPEH